MLTIDRMATTYRVAGPSARRDAVMRRLDRMVRTALVDALAPLAQDFADEDGPYIVVRQLRLALWLDPTGIADPAIARLWADTLAEALYRDIAGAPRDRVARYDNRTAYLADWLADLPGGRGQGDWRYAEFAVLDGQDPGRAAAMVLGREARLIGPTLALLQRQSRLARFASVLSGADIARIWQDWTGDAAAPGPTVSGAVARARGSRSALALTDPADPDARARLALGWLVALTTAPGGLRPEVAAPLALQIATLAALVQALPDLRRMLAAAEPAAGIAAALEAAPPALHAAAAWLRRVAATAPSRRLAALAALAAPEVAASASTGAAEHPLHIRSAFAGTGLLLPAIRDLHLASRLGPTGLLHLLAAAVSGPLRPLAEADRGLRWLAGCPPDQLPTVEVDWPLAEQLAPPVRALADDAATIGDGPEGPALRAVLDRFCVGLRGQDGASAAFIARQFLIQPGEIVIRRRDITLRLGAVPLRLLLVMAGRTGPQGALPWLAGRRLIVEVAHA